MARRGAGRIVRSRLEVVSTVGDRGLTVVLALLALGMPTVFLRSTHTVFTVPKFTLLLLGTLLASVLWALGWTNDRPSRPADAVAGLGVLLAGLLVVGTVVSEYQGLAALGSGFRYSGLATWLAYLLLLGAASRACRGSGLDHLVVGIVGAMALVAGYGLVQTAGVDPLDWADSLSFDVDAQTTLGNPNFASAMLAVGSPLVLAVLFSDRSPGPLRIVTALLFTGAMVMIGKSSSTQGDVGAALCLPVVFLWVASRVRGRRLRAAGLAAPVPLLVLSIPTLLREASASGWLALLGLSVGWGLVLARWSVPAREHGEATSAGRWRRPGIRGVVAWPAGLLLTGGAVLGGWLVLPGVMSGLSGRRHLWAVAWEMFLERPVFGHGLGTFGTAFTRLRPAENAVASGTHLSNSPHSLPLDLLAGGGLLVFLAYLALLGTIAVSGIRAIRMTTGDRRLLLLGVAGGWLAFQAQSLVSVDTVGLGWAQWLLGGALVAAGNDVRGSGVPSVRPWRLVPGLRGRVAVAGVVVVIALALVPWVTRPLRADLASSDARWAMASGDLEEAAEQLDRAIRLEPRNGEHVSARASLFRIAGQGEEAYRLSRRAVDLIPGNPLMARQAARDAVLTWRVPGRLAEARAWYREVVRLDPHVPEHRQEAADFLTSIGRQDEAAGILLEQGS